MDAHFGHPIILSFPNINPSPQQSSRDYKYDFQLLICSFDATAAAAGCLDARSQGVIST